MFKARKRRSGHDGRLVVQPVFCLQSGDGGAKAVDDRQAARGCEQVRKPGEGALACGAEAGTNIGFAQRSTGCAIPEASGNPLEA